MPYTDYLEKRKTIGDKLNIAPRLLNVGSECTDPFWYNLAHSHAACELLYVTEGSESALICGQRYEVNAGAVSYTHLDVYKRQVHLRQAVQPRIGCAPSWKSSVSIPWFSRRADISESAVYVQPFGLGLPLIRRTFIENHPLSVDCFLTISIPCMEVSCYVFVLREKTKQIKCGFGSRRRDSSAGNSGNF